MKHLTIVAIILAFSLRAGAQGLVVPDRLTQWASDYRAPGLPKLVGKRPRKCEVDSMVIDTARNTLMVYMNEVFASQQWTAYKPQQIYTQVRGTLPDNLKKYTLEIRTVGRPIEHLAPYAPLDTLSRLPAQNYLGEPWVKNVSLPYSFDHGLAGRHIALWASHGYFWNEKKKKQWEWQRPLIWDVREDLLTPRIAYELVVPMLERAGAIVWSPRERCPSRTEIITDNDHSPLRFYKETDGQYPWESAGRGFAPIDTLLYGDNPFERGTSRICRGQSSAQNASTITYTPDIRKRERLAVYASYKTVAGSTTGARYMIYHSGIETTVTVNQTMGGSTWVYLGDFQFMPGDPTGNCVIISNQVTDGGYVTADAVRFGGGMGNTLRGDSLSGLRRYEEGARYSMQWAGMDTCIYSTYAGADDYKDDINVRSMATNHLCGGSVYNPDTTGLGVPIEMSLAIHTDAGVDKEGLIGSLAVATTRSGDGRLATGASRLLSRDLAEEVLTSICRDMPVVAGRWNRRELWDRNYSETRLPVVPAAIIEVLSHENLNDVNMVQDSTYRFHIARAIYKGVLRFIYNMHGEGQRLIVQPLPVSKLEWDGKVVKWQPTRDPLESTAMPSHYLVQVAIDGHDFDNGTLITTTSASINVQDASKITVRISAINAGGASMPKEITL